MNLVSGEQDGLRVVVDNYGSMLETDDYMTLSLGNGATWAARQAGSFAGEPFGISFYPNPVQRHATVSWEPSFNPTSMRVTDAMGKLMRASSIMSQGTMTFETGRFPSGIYSVQLIGKEGIKTIRFLKE